MPRYGGAYPFLGSCRLVSDTVLVLSAGLQMMIRHLVFIL